MDGQVLHNEQLETALDEFDRDRQKETYARVMEILEKSVVLLPSMPPEGIDEETQELLRTGQTVQLSEDVKIVPCLLKKEDGNRVLPIFTSADQIPSDKKSPVVLALPFQACLSMVMSNQDHVDTMVLNPFTHNMTLSRGILEVAVNRRNTVQQVKTVSITGQQFQQLLHNRVTLQLLPAFLFKNGEEGLKRLQKEEGALLVPFYKETFPEGRDAAIAAALSEFSVMTLNITDDMQITRLDMPGGTEKKGMCYRVYVVFRRGSRDMQYYTLEKTEQGNYFGKVAPDGKHELVEPVPGNGTEIETVMNLATVM